MILEILLGITTIISIVLGWTTYNQLQKVERLEEWVEEYSQKIIDTKTTLDLHDSEGKFESEERLELYLME